MIQRAIPPAGMLAIFWASPARSQPLIDENIKNLEEDCDVAPAVIDEIFCGMVQSNTKPVRVNPRFNEEI
jgi:hypothetical protein